MVQFTEEKLQKIREIVAHYPEGKQKSALLPVLHIAQEEFGRWLSADQHRDYTAWIDNDRRLHELLARLEALGATAFEADPRWKR